MNDQPHAIPPGRLAAYRMFFLVERLVAAALFIVALTMANSSTPMNIWWLLMIGAVGFAGLAAWSAYGLATKS